MRIPCLHLGPLTHRLHLASMLPHLHCGPSSHQFLPGSLIPRLHLGQASPCSTTGILASSYTSALHPFSSTGFCLPSSSTIVPSQRHHSGILDPCLCLGPMSSQLHLGTLYLRCHPGSLSPQLRLGLYRGQLHLRRMHPWSLIPGLHYGSSLL